MRDLNELAACFARLRRLGYSRRAALRIALWACDPDRPYLEN